MTTKVVPAERIATDAPSMAAGVNGRIPGTIVLGIALRGLVVAFALALVLIAGAGGGSLLTASILALGATMLGWRD